MTMYSADQLRLKQPYEAAKALAEELQVRNYGNDRIADNGGYHSEIINTFVPPRRFSSLPFITNRGEWVFWNDDVYVENSQYVSYGNTYNAWKWRKLVLEYAKSFDAADGWMGESWYNLEIDAKELALYKTDDLDAVLVPPRWQPLFSAEWMEGIFSFVKSMRYIRWIDTLQYTYYTTGRNGISIAHTVTNQYYDSANLDGHNYLCTKYPTAIYYYNIDSGICGFFRINGEGGTAEFPYKSTVALGKIQPVLMIADISSYITAHGGTIEEE